jgi:CRP/FNR family transcriptional regulator, cyclic AMP receptor protein
LANEVDAKAQLFLVRAGDVLIEQNGTDNDIYLLLAGTLDISVNGRIIRRRLPNDHVGEMAALEPTQRRSATVTAAEDSVVAKLSEADFADLGSRYPQIYLLSIAKELARRLLQRNVLVSQARDKIRVFVISSAESLAVARVIQNAFEHDPFTTTVWTDGVYGQKKRPRRCPIPKTCASTPITRRI